MIWPKGTREGQKLHSFRHVACIEDAILRCKKYRTVVQAGGNVGLWPIRLSSKFQRVITFEPEPATRKCLKVNVKPFNNIEVRGEALGSAAGLCGIVRQSLGSHYVKPGDDITVITIDSLQLTDVDLIQLDIEGKEYEALQGSLETIQSTFPVIQVEMNNMFEITNLLSSIGYKLASKQQHRDAVFDHD